MPKFCEVYTEEQRRAVAGAMLGDFGEPMSARAAVQAAARGELGLPPFEMNAKSAYTYRDHEQTRRLDDAPGAQPGPALLESLAGRAAALLSRELSRLEAETQKGKPLNGEAARHVVRGIRELEPILRRPNTATREPARDDAAGAQRGRGLLSELAKEEAEQGAANAAACEEPQVETTSPTAAEGVSSRARLVAARVRARDEVAAA